MRFSAVRLTLTKTVADLSEANMGKRYTVIVYVKFYGSTVHHFHDIVTTLDSEAIERYFRGFSYGEGEVMQVEIREDL